MIFDFLKKIFGWADEGSKKRKISEACNFEKEYVTPKKLKTSYNTAQWMEDYSDIDDSDNNDIEFLGEEIFSPINSCTKSNGTHRRKPQPYQFHTTTMLHTTPLTCKSTFPSLHHDNATIPCFTNQRHKTQHTGQQYLTLCKTNQLKERHQYEELLQNFLPSRIQILKNKRREYTPMQNAVEVIDLDKTEDVTEIQFDKKRQVPTKTLETTSHWCSKGILNDKTDKRAILTLASNEKDNASYSQSIKIKKSDVNTAKLDSTSPAKVVTTNSLRDELAAKTVMRQDFIPQVSKRYNERIEQRYKEAEELKRMACVLSKHNRYAREAALEEQLARSMRLCLAVLDDREEPEEILLPTLSEEMLREIQGALVPCSPDEVLTEGFGLKITRKDIHTLAGLNWLNDEVINFYMNLLIARGTAGKYPKVHAMNTFFYPKLLSGGHSSLKRWTRKVDIFAQDLVVVPVHLNIHWCMSIIDFRDKAIVYYDSMGSSNPKCLVALKQYLQDESLDKKKQAYDMNDWKLQSAKDIPQQMNGSDCGVFSCMFAEYVCANKKITFTQQDMPYFRNKMVYEILKSKLL